MTFSMPMQSRKSLWWHLHKGEWKSCRHEGQHDTNGSVWSFLR